MSGTWEFDVMLQGGREVRMSGRDWRHACERAADLYDTPVVAWRNPPVQLRIGMGDES